MCGQDCVAADSSEATRYELLAYSGVCGHERRALDHMSVAAVVQHIGTSTSWLLDMHGKPSNSIERVILQQLYSDWISSDNRTIIHAFGSERFLERRVSLIRFADSRPSTWLDRSYDYCGLFC